MATYVCVNCVYKGDVLFLPEQDIELTEAEAEALLESSGIAEKPAKPKAEPKAPAKN